MDQDTAVPIINAMIATLGGTPTATTVVPALNQLAEVIGTVDPEAIEASVNAWLDEHPEATTTVEDGAINRQKLADDMYAVLSLSDIDNLF